MEFGAPRQQILSEGDKLIKDLVQKQSNNNIELKTQLTESKEFQLPKQLVTITNYTSGQVDSVTFKKCAEFVNDLEELHSFGLTADEIQLYSENHQNGEEYICSKRKNICKSILRQKLDTILQKINDAKKKRDATQKLNAHYPVSRHLKDLALCVKPDSLETKLYNFALSCTPSKPDQPLSDPIHRLPQLESELFGSRTSSVGVPSLKKRRKRARKYLDRAQMGEELVFNYGTGPKISKWDVQTPPPPQKSENEPKKVYSCCPPVNYYTIKDNQIVKLETNKPEV